MSFSFMHIVLGDVMFIILAAGADCGASSDGGLSANCKTLPRY